MGAMDVLCKVAAASIGLDVTLSFCDLVGWLLGAGIWIIKRSDGSTAPGAASAGVPGGPGHD